MNINTIREDNHNKVEGPWRGGKEERGGLLAYPPINTTQKSENTSSFMSCESPVGPAMCRRSHAVGARFAGRAPEI